LHEILKSFKILDSMATQIRVPNTTPGLLNAGPERLPFYAGAEYWGGEAMRRGDIQPDPVIYSGPARITAAYMLRRRAKQAFPRQAVDAYEGGDIFRADDYENGTIAVFHNEGISPRDNMCRVVDMDDCLTEGLPDRPTDLSFSMTTPRLHLPISAKRTGLVYRHDLRVGIVTQNMMGRKCLASVRACDVYFEWLGRLKTPFTRYAVEPSEIEVGSTMHFGKRLGDYSERLYRINSLEVWHLGKSAAKEVARLK
jgi:hypothetical protein